MTRDELLRVKQRFGIIGDSPLINQAINVAVQVAPTDLSVLVTGESGTGKEFFPKIIHEYSSRKHEHYQAVNCAAIPEGTIDSELFGHEKGSFTGAIADRKGYFEVSDGGTLFLDEVGELPLSTQARLLRVLESGEFIRVGSNKVQKTNVRVVAATNRNLLESIKKGHFREDLYYRLNTIPIIVPPLRERPHDILLLFRKFSSDMSARYGTPKVELSQEVKDSLMNYRWPGNIRELKNVAERVSVLYEQQALESTQLRTFFDSPSDTSLVLYQGNEPASEANFTNERELLYKILFDMKNDMNDLKALVNHLMSSSNAVSSVAPTMDNASLHSFAHQVAVPVQIDHDNLTQTNLTPQSEEAHETISLEDMEREHIRKVLEQHAGRRKTAAEELKISERTLYRKIKEYGL